MFHWSTCLPIPVQIPNFLYYCSFTGLTAGTSGWNKLIGTFHPLSTTISILEVGFVEARGLNQYNQNFRLCWEFWDTTALSCLTSALTNMAATSHVWLLTWQSMKMKISVPQLHESHFQCSAAMSGWWPPCRAAETQNISIMAGSSLERAATADAACRCDAWSCQRPHEEASIGTKQVLRESRNWSPPHRADCYRKAGVFLWDATDTPILKAGFTQVFCCLQPETT